MWSQIYKVHIHTCIEKYQKSDYLQVVWFFMYVFLYVTDLLHWNFLFCFFLFWLWREKNLNNVEKSIKVCVTQVYASLSTLLIL